MGEAASAQLESIRYDLANLEPSSDEARALASISSDLELFVEQAAKQRDKVAANPNPNPNPNPNQLAAHHELRRAHLVGVRVRVSYP